jgi:cytochrome c oxidase assembly factor CtaG
MVGAVVAALGAGAVGDGSLTAHMVEHLLLGMVVPFLVALAAPVTLLLQTAGPAHSASLTSTNSPAPPSTQMADHFVASASPKASPAAQRHRW